MEWQAWVTIGAIVLMMGLLAFTRIGPDLVLLGVLALLITLRIVTPAQGLAGFANEGMITVGLLFVVAAGIQETGAMTFLAQRVLGRPKSLFAALFRLLFPTAFLSAFMNNTPQVAIMIPVVKDWARKNQIPASKLMIPLSYATILGGLCTLIGTSTNLIISGLVVSQMQRPPLGLFEMTWLGVPCAVTGLVYLLLLSPWLLPDRRPAISEQDDPRQYTVEMLVDRESPLVGQTIEQAGLRHLTGMYLMEINRKDQVLAAVGPQERLQAEDRLIFVGIVDSVVELQKIRGLNVATNQVFKLNAPRSHRCLIEAVVSNSGPLVGKTIREGRFRTNYDAAIIAVGRDGERVMKKIGDIVLKAGDTLLLEAHPWFLERHRNSRDFFLLSRVEDSTPPRHDRMWFAIAILGGMILVASMGWLSMVHAALLAALLMILTRCCSGPDARRSMEWQILVVIAASLGIGKAVEASGAAGHIAGSFIQLAGKNPWIALVVIYGVTMLFTEFMSHSASVVLVFPIALATARTLEVNSMPYVMAIMMAASCGFATPIGYQTNLMVYGPGNYRFGDYLRVGLPLNLLIWVVTVLIAPLVWPF